MKRNQGLAAIAHRPSRMPKGCNRVGHGRTATGGRHAVGLTEPFAWLAAASCGIAGGCRRHFVWAGLLERQARKAVDPVARSAAGGAATAAGAHRDGREERARAGRSIPLSGASGAGDGGQHESAARRWGLRRCHRECGPPDASPGLLQGGYAMHNCGAKSDLAVSATCGMPIGYWSDAPRTRKCHWARAASPCCCIRSVHAGAALVVGWCGCCCVVGLTVKTMIDPGGVPLGLSGRQTSATEFALCCAHATSRVKMSQLLSHLCVGRDCSPTATATDALAPCRRKQ